MAGFLHEILAKSFSNHSISHPWLLYMNSNKGQIKLLDMRMSKGMGRGMGMRKGMSKGMRMDQGTSRGI